jgi:hypothetical protein
LARSAGALILAGCGVPAWPVPVPPDPNQVCEPQPAGSVASGEPLARMDVRLPLCGGHAKCADRDRLRAFLADQVSRCAMTPAARTLPAEIDALVTALAKGPFSTNDFPRAATALPADFREQKVQVALDGSRSVPEDSAAVPYRGFWWTFWDRQALTELPTAKASGYSHLIVFPEFEGREPCAELR